MPTVAAIAVIASLVAACDPAMAADLAASGGEETATFNDGALSGFLLIFFSEIGDKTFFIAVLLALQQARGLVFAGTFGALAVMTVISVALGRVFHTLDEVLPFDTQGLPVDDYLAVALLVFFGIQTLLSAGSAKEDQAEEKEEAEEVVQAFGTKESTALILSTFSLVFAAEWGDKSFLATIALAAASDPYGVTVGAVAGHGVATGLAVTGGAFLGQYVSEQVVAYVGGSLFLVFAAITLYETF